MGSEMLLNARGRPILKLSWALPALRHLSDGRWFGPYQEDAYDRHGEIGLLKLTGSAVWGAVMGLVEVDEDGWWRITPTGRLALAQAQRAAQDGGGEP